MGEAERKETSGPGGVARAFHKATKHSFQSVRRRGHSLDWDNKPNPFKVIPGSDRTEAGSRPLRRRMVRTVVVEIRTSSFSSSPRIRW